MKVVSLVTLVTFSFSSVSLPSISLAEVASLSALEIQLQQVESEIKKQLPKNSLLNARQITNEAIRSYTKVLRAYSSLAEESDELTSQHNASREELLYEIQLLQFDTKLHNKLQSSGQLIIQQAMNETTRQIVQIAPELISSFSLIENEGPVADRESGPPRELLPINPSDELMNPGVNPGPPPPPSPNACNGIWAWVLWLLCVIIVPGGTVFCSLVWLWICTRAS